MSTVNGRIYQVGYQNNPDKAEKRLRLVFLASIALLAGVFYSEFYSGTSTPERAKVLDEYMVKSARHVRFIVESGPFKGQIADEDTSLSGNLFQSNQTYVPPGTEVEIGVKQTPIFKILRASAPTQVFNTPDSSESSSKPKLK